jgi:hypothetical protein
VIEGGDEFGGTIEGGIFKEGVGEEVKTTSFFIHGGWDGRSGWNNEVDGISSAAKEKRDKGGGVITGSNRMGRGNIFLEQYA